MSLTLGKHLLTPVMTITLKLEMILQNILRRVVRNILNNFILWNISPTMRLPARFHQKCRTAFGRCEHQLVNASIMHKRNALSILSNPTHPIYVVNYRHLFINEMPSYSISWICILSRRGLRKNALPKPRVAIFVVAAVLYLSVISRACWTPAVMRNTWSS